MFIFKSSEQSGEFGLSGRQIKEALGKSQAIISFTPDGIILHAMKNFWRQQDIVRMKFRGNIIACSVPLKLPIPLNIKHFVLIWLQVCRTQVS